MEWLGFWGIVLAAIIAAAGGIYAAKISHANRKEIATSNGNTLGQLVEQIATRQDEHGEKLDAVTEAQQEFARDFLTHLLHHHTEVGHDTET
jgi:hypothetical protein